jgi:hypothetical protein
MSTTSVAGKRRQLTSHEEHQDGHQEDPPKNQEGC